MPFDREANLYWGIVRTPPQPPLIGEALTVAADGGGDFPPPPFTAVITPPHGNAPLEDCEIVRVSAISGDTLTLERAVGIRQTVHVGDQIKTSIVVIGG